MKSNIVPPSLLNDLSITKITDFTFYGNAKMRSTYFRWYFTMIDNADEVAAWFKITNRASNALKN